MTRISDLSVDGWKAVVVASNARAMSKSPRYPTHEGEFLKNCCVFGPPTCGPSCFCRQVGCTGVWSLRPDLEFDTFLASYADLWVRGSGWFKQTVNGTESWGHSPRWDVPVRLFRRLKLLWVNWDGHGTSLPQAIHHIRRCYFCDDAFDLIEPVAHGIGDLAPDSTGVYTSKLISQLVYDIAVPFDTESAKEQKRSGYNPMRYGNGRMRQEARQWVERHRVSVDEFRRLDDAPLKWWQAYRRPDAGYGTACSRVLDKLFYG